MLRPELIAIIRIFVYIFVYAIFRQKLFDYFPCPVDDYRHRGYHHFKNGMQWKWKAILVFG